MFNSVGSLLGASSKRTKTAGILAVLRIRQTAKEVLFDNLHDLPAEVTRPIKVATFKGGTLTIVAPRAVFSELQMRSGGLISEINKRFGKKIVERLRFRAV